MRRIDRSIALIPGAPLQLVILGVQVLAGIMLPSAIIFFLRLLLNDKEALGDEYINKGWNDWVNWTVIVLFILSLILAAQVVAPNLFPHKLGTNGNMSVLRFLRADKINEIPRTSSWCILWRYPRGEGGHLRAWAWAYAHDYQREAAADGRAGLPDPDGVARALSRHGFGARICEHACLK